METPEERGFVLKISEYGKVVRQYHDTDYIRFMDNVKVIVASHLNHNIKQVGITQSKPEVKNVQISFYTN